MACGVRSSTARSLTKPERQSGRFLFPMMISEQQPAAIIREAHLTASDPTAVSKSCPRCVTAVRLLRDATRRGVIVGIFSHDLPCVSCVARCVAVAVRFFTSISKTCVRNKTWRYPFRSSPPCSCASGERGEACVGGGIEVNVRIEGLATMA